MPGFIIDKHITLIWGGLTGGYMDSGGDAAMERALHQLMRAAEQRGANAVTGVRFTGVATGTNVVAYGNAVWVSALP